MMLGPPDRLLPPGTEAVTRETQAHFRSAVSSLSDYSRMCIQIPTALLIKGRAAGAALVRPFCRRRDVPHNRRGTLQGSKMSLVSDQASCVPAGEHTVPKSMSFDGLHLESEHGTACFLAPMLPAADPIAGQSAGDAKVPNSELAK